MTIRLGHVLVLALAVVAASSEVADAAGRGGHTRTGKKKWCTKTVTTTVLTGLYIPAGSPSGSTGNAEYKTVTVTTQFFCWSSTTTQSSLTVSFAGATGFDGQTITIESNHVPNDLNASVVVSNGGATLSLSTAKGDTVPVFQKSDQIKAFDATPAPFAIWIFNTDPVTTVTTNGK